MPQGFAQGLIVDPEVDLVVEFQRDPIQIGGPYGRHAVIEHGDLIVGHRATRMGLRGGWNPLGFGSKRIE